MGAHQWGVKQGWACCYDGLRVLNTTGVVDGRQVACRNRIDRPQGQCRQFGHLAGQRGAHTLPRCPARPPVFVTPLRRHCLALRTRVYQIMTVCVPVKV